MRADQDFDPQPADETDILRDPSYLQWSAACEAETDHSVGISLTDGIAKLRQRGADEEEQLAYAQSYNAEAIRSLLADAGIPSTAFVNPYTDPLKHPF